MLYDMKDALCSRYSRMNNSLIRKSAAGEIEDFRGVNKLLYFEEYKFKLQKKLKNHTLLQPKMGPKRFISQLNSVQETDSRDETLVTKLDTLLASKNVSQSVLLTYICLKLIRGLHDFKNKKYYLNKLIAIFQDLDERPSEANAEVLSSKFVLSCIISRMEDLF